jgi:gliding motility-associated-like protein
MKTKITLFTLILFFSIGSYSFAQTVSGTASTTGCQNSGTITASSTGLGAAPEYQLLLSGVAVYPIPGDLTQFSTTNVYTSLANGTYTIRARENSLGTVYSSTNITINDGYINMTTSTPTKVLECTGGASSLTSNVTGGKAPYIFKIALQSSPAVFIETSTAQSSLSYTFGTVTPLPAGSYVVSVTDNCGTTITGATSITNPSVSIDDIKLNTKAYFNLTVPTDCNSIINVNNETGFVYSASGNPITVADAAKFTWKLRFQNQLYGQGGVVGGPGFALSSTKVPAPAVATRDAILADENTATPSAMVLIDACGNEKVYPFVDINKTLSVLTAINCQGTPYVISHSYSGLACFPMTVTFTNTANPADVVTATLASGNNDMVSGFTPGGRYSFTSVDAAGYTSGLWANNTLLMPTTSTFNPAQRVVAVQQNLNRLNYGILQINMPSILPGQTGTVEVVSSSNPTTVPVGTTISDIFINNSGYMSLPAVNATDPANYWPTGTYTLRVSTGCGSKDIVVNVGGYNATLNNNTITPICGGFNYVMNANLDIYTAYQVFIVSGPSNVGAFRDFQSATASLPFNGLTPGNYVFALRIKGGAANVLTQTVNFSASSVINVDRSNTGGYVCTAGGTGTLNISATTLSPAPNNTLQYALSTDGGLTYGAYQASGSFTGLTAGTYFFKVQDGCGNIITSSSQIGVATAPIATANGDTGPVTECAATSGSLQLDVNILGASSYLWTGPGITTANQNLKNPSVLYSALSAGVNNYTVQVTLGAPCNTSTSTTLDVFINQVPSLIITNPPSACTPGSVNITAPSVTAGSTSNLTYTYYKDQEATVVQANPNAINISGTYYIKGTDSNGCFTISPVVVTINPTPAVVVVKPAAVCAPAVIDITSPAITAGSTTGLTYTYFSDAAGTQVLANANAITTGGTYYIKGTNSVTGCFAITPVVVTINPVPALTVNNPVAICAGQSVDLTTVKTGTGSSYNYFASDQTTLLGSTIVSPNVTTDYYIQAVSEGNCTSVKQKVTVTVITNPTLNITNPATICSGGTVDLTAAAVTAGSTPGLTYTYYTDAAANNILPNPNAVSTGGIYYIKGTNSSGCFVIRPVTVTVNTSPIASFTYSIINNANDEYLFTSTSTSLGLSNGVTHTWSFGDGTFSNLESPTHQYSSSGTYTVTLLVTNTNGCPSSASETIVVTKDLNIAAGFTINDVDQCLNVNNFIFTNNSTVSAGYTITGYSWNFGDGSAVNNTQNPAHNYAAAGNYTVTLTVTASNGVNSFSDTASSTVIVFVNPTVIITNPQPVCSGSTVNLTDAAITNGSTLGIIYTYYTDSAGTQPLANPNAVSSSGTYYIKGTNLSACSDLKPVVVTINPLPVLVTNNPAKVCKGTSVDLTAAAVTAGSSSGLTYTYYSDAAATIVLSNPNAVINSGIYYVKGTNINGCFNIQPVTVTINELPTASFDYKILNNTNDTYLFNSTSSSQGSNADLSYVWDFGDGSFSISEAPSHQYVSAGTYTVNLFITNDSGCTDSLSKTITITKDPNVAAGFTINNAEQCVGNNNYILTDTSILNTGYTITDYSWDFGDGSPVSKTEVPSHVYTAAATYIITLTVVASDGINTFSDSATGSVTIVESPVLNLVNPLPICSGSSIDLTADEIRVGSSSDLTYSYYLDPAGTQPLTSPEAITISGNYYIKATNSAGCSEIGTITVVVNSSPAGSIAYLDIPYCKTGTASVTQTGQAGGFYTGDAGLVIDPADGTIDLVASTAGNHNVTYTFSNGICSNTFTTPIAILPLPTASISYPNTIYCNRGTAAVVQTGTANGVYSSTTGLIINSVNGEIDLASSTPGTYTITYTFNDGTCSNSVVTEIIITQSALPAPLPDIVEQCSATPVPPTLLDPCAGIITASTSTPFPITTQGVTIVTWTFSYGNGYTQTINQNVVIDDTTAPVIPLLANLTGQCAVSPVPPTTTDNCSGTITGTSTTTFPVTAQGTTVIVWTFNDGNGNSVTANQNVIIADTTPPVFLGVLPIDTTIDCSVPLPATPTLTAEDNCSAATVIYSEVKIDGSCSGNYQIERTWTASDLASNQTVYKQIITVQDITGPVFAETLPPPIVNADCKTIPDPVILTATDTCGNAAVVYTETKVDGDCTSNYSLIRTWTAEDNCGNETAFTQTINVSCLSDGDIYNAISPNGDGKNDIFKISGIDCYPDNTVKIYNRYGVVVYEKDGYDNVTNPFEGYSDGRSTVKRGDKLPTGTYFYTVQYNNAGNKIEKSGYLFISNQ